MTLQRPYYVRKSRIDPYAGEIASWVEPAARSAYVAKGTAYLALCGVEALVLLGDRTPALRRMGEAPFLQAVPVARFLAQVFLWAAAAGLAAYVVWRVTQALMDPEGRGTGLWAVVARGACLLSGMLYGWLAVVLVRVAWDASPADPLGLPALLDRLAGEGASGWLAGILTGALALRGIAEMYLGVKPYLPQEIRLAGLRGRPADRVLALGRMALLLRGGALALLGGVLLVTSPADGPAVRETATWFLSVLEGGRATWLLAVLVGTGTVYALYQFAKARYRLIGEY